MEEYDEMANKLAAFPSDVVINILTKVPTKPILQFKCVSRDWLGIISSSNFIKRHVRQSIRANSCGTLVVCQGCTLYSLDFHNDNFLPTKLYYPENINIPQPGIYLRMVGSCNGLLCIEFGSQISLYNPATRAHKIIPEYTLGGVQRERKRPKILFAYDSVSEDYRVVRFSTRGTSLYSLSSNSWNVIENHKSVEFPGGVVANNSVYWMNSNSTHIKSFDILSGRYNQMHLPEKISPEYSPNLGVLGGRLYLVTRYLNIWKLEDSGDWIKIFRCPSSQFSAIHKLESTFLNPRGIGPGYSLVCSEDERKILVACISGPLNFVCCNLELQEATIIETSGLSLNKFADVLPWAASLVPLLD